MTSTGHLSWSIMSRVLGRSHPQGAGRTPRRPWRPLLGGRAQLRPLREGKQGRGEWAVLQAHLRKFLPRLSCVMVKIMFLPCVFSSNRRCSCPTLQPHPCSRSSHGLTAEPSASPGRSQPWGERNQDTAPGVQGRSQSISLCSPPSVGLVTAR